MADEAVTGCLAVCCIATFSPLCCQPIGGGKSNRRHPSRLKNYEEPKADTRLAAVEKGSKVPSEALHTPVATANPAGTETLAELLRNSEKGVLVFAVPSEGRPGRQQQFEAFAGARRHEVEGAGYRVYALSRATAVAEESSPCTVLCDDEGNLTQGLGFYSPAGGLKMGVSVIDREATVVDWRSGATGVLAAAVDGLPK